MQRSVLRPLLALVLLLTGMATALAYGPWIVWRAHDARSWPTVEGIVMRAELVAARKGGRPAWQPRVEVRYSVEGREYTTDALWIGGDRRFRDAARAREVLARYPIGGQVPVSVHPDDPSDAVLETGEVWRAWLVVGFGLVLILAGVLVIVRRD